MTTLLEVHLPEHASHVRVELHAGDADPRWIDVWDTALESFATVLRLGGFGDTSAHDNALSIEPIDATTRAYTLRAADRGIAPGAWRILANLLIARATWAVPLGRITITAAGESRNKPLRYTANELRAAPYPARRDDVPFPCAITPNVHAAGAVTLRLGLTRPATAQEIGYWSDALANWVDVANGGYGDDLTPPEDCVVTATDLYELDPHTLEMHYAYFDASYDAWDTVINMLARDDTARMLVAAFTVEP